MTKEQILGKLIASLHKKISENNFDDHSIDEATRELTEHFKPYDVERFPQLIETNNFTKTCPDTPKNLAEALLWKLGKWKSYEKFCKNYGADNPEPTKQDVVFYAFAMHLKDKNNPIYDQHAMRSLWAIGKLTSDESQKCKSLLFNGKDEWKDNASGNHTIECYRIFVKHINHLISRVGEHSEGKLDRLSKLDRLLMPLGQAIKMTTKTYSQFKNICGRDIT